MDCESGAQWKRIICFLLSQGEKKRNFFEGQELLIGLPFKAISKLLLPLLACKNRYTGRHSIIGGNHPAAQGAAAAAGRLWGVQGVQASR